MISKKIGILLLIILLPVVSRTQVITVKQDGSGDVTNIQQGVDLAQDGDTVLVWPGIYYENVLCQNKNITIASLVLTTSDKSYMYQTKIDGNFTGSCLKIRDCTAGVTVCGFITEHGSGSFHGSISGGGISIENVQSIFLKDCLVQNNKVTGDGGGIYTETTSTHLAGVTICSNQAYGCGGGIFALSNPIDFDSLDLCNIYLNYASQGTDIYKLSFGDPIHLVLDTFTVANPDYYYLFSYAGWGYPGDDITYQINAGKIEGMTQDLYVAPWGDNANNGLNPGEPLKEISYALLKMQSDNISPDTIHLADGIYGPSTGEKFPLSLKANVSIRGTSRDSTILDGENELWILSGIVYADHYQISDLTISNGSSIYNIMKYGAIDLDENNNSSFSNLLFTGNHGTISSCGTIINSNKFSLYDVEFNNNIGGQALRIFHSNADTLFYDSVSIYNCYFRENQPEYITPDEAFGGSLVFSGEAYGPYSNLITGYVFNSLFEDNITKDYIWGGANSLDLGFGAYVSVINCTFGYNISENPEGANIGVTYNSDLNVYNSIMYGNYPAEFYMYAFDGEDCNLSVYNSLVAGGEEGIRILSPWNNLYYDPSNIDTDPMWDTAGPWPYSLLEGSPCIDAGTLDLPPDIVLPETDITGNPRVWGNSVDMGAYEYGPWVKVPELPSSKFKVQSAKLLEANPNPFHYQTDIYYKNLQKGRLKIQVFDLQGTLLTTLADFQTVSGQGKFSWNGTTTTGIRLPVGVYILRLSVNDVVKESLKIILE